jgi:hypothetical protein
MVTAAALTTLVGCKVLTTTAPASSIPVVSGVATTNDLEAVAVIKEAQALNATYDPTPYAAPINAALGGLAALITAASGFYLRHKMSTPPKS